MMRVRLFILKVHLTRTLFPRADTATCFRETNKQRHKATDTSAQCLVFRWQILLCSVVKRDHTGVSWPLFQASNLGLKLLMGYSIAFSRNDKNVWITE